MDLKTYLHAKRGRLVRLAEAIDAHASDISAWANKKRPVPIPYGWPIERETGGQVTRADLFPAKVIRDTWPDLGDRPGRTDATDDVQPPAGVPDRKEGE